MLQVPRRREWRVLEPPQASRLTCTQPPTNLKATMRLLLKKPALPDSSSHRSWSGLRAWRDQLQQSQTHFNSNKPMLVRRRRNVIDHMKGIRGEEELCGNELNADLALAYSYSLYMPKDYKESTNSNTVTTTELFTTRIYLSLWVGLYLIDHTLSLNTSPKLHFCKVEIVLKIFSRSNL
jgi:hypothetical protein